MGRGAKCCGHRTVCAPVPGRCRRVLRRTCLSAFLPSRALHDGPRALVPKAPAAIAAALRAPGPRDTRLALTGGLAAAAFTLAATSAP